MSKKFTVALESLSPEVTGSGLILKIKRPSKQLETLLIDYGGIQESKYKALNNSLDFEPSEISNVIVTHSHLDHIEKLPLLVKNGYYSKIRCSKPCTISIPISLNDSVKIMKNEYDHLGIPMLYEKKDVDNTVSLLNGIEYNSPQKISKYITLTLLGNGHLYGAACILLQISCPKYPDINILVTGDYYPNNELFKVKAFPEWVLNLDNLNIVQESTYGTKSLSSIPYVFDNYIQEEISKNKFIELPVITQERLELVLLRLKKLQDCGKLSNFIPIYIHTELGKQYLNNIYLHNKEINHFMPKNVKILKKDDYVTALLAPNPKILLAGSGMADAGSIKFYLKNTLHRSDVSVIFTCYTADNTLGSILKHCKTGNTVRLSCQNIPVNATIKSTSEFSHHVKFEQTLNFLSRFNSISNVFLTHGETAQKNMLCTELKSKSNNFDVYILDRNTGYNITAPNYVTSYITNFYDHSKLRSANQYKKNKSKLYKNNKLRKTKKIEFAH